MHDLGSSDGLLARLQEPAVVFATHEDSPNYWASNPGSLGMSAT
jgi:hypothetical protein